MSDQIRNGSSESTSHRTPVELHRISWSAPGDECPVLLYLAGNDQAIVRRAAARLAQTISTEGGIPVLDDTLVSADTDPDDIPF